MSPEEALQLIDQVLSKIQATRQDHMKIGEAVKTLDDFIHSIRVKEKK